MIKFLKNYGSAMFFFTLALLAFLSVYVQEPTTLAENEGQMWTFVGGLTFLVISHIHMPNKPAVASSKEVD